MTGRLIIALAMLLGVLGYAGPAAAHVTVDPDDAVQGGYARVVFRVPNERPETTVTSVRVDLPEEQPIAGVRTMAVPGWQVELEHREPDEPLELHGQEIDTVVSRITWTPTTKRGGIDPDQFAEFPVSLGPLPETSELVFSASQTYSDGEQVRWADDPTNGEAAEHPAPVLRLAEPPAADAAVTATREATPEPRAATRASGTPLWLGIVALLIALVAMSLAGAAYVRSRPEVDRFTDEDDEAEPYDDQLPDATLEGASAADTDPDADLDDGPADPERAGVVERSDEWADQERADPERADDHGRAGPGRAGADAGSDEVDVVRPRPSTPPRPPESE